MPTLEEILRRDQLRAAYIQRKFSGGDQELRAAYDEFSAGDAKDGAGVVKLLELDDGVATVPVTLGSSVGTPGYVITVGIGSPAVNQTMLIDTGSDVAWVQCEPCSQCHPQVEPLFDPSSSSTYSPISCTSATCTELDKDKAGNGCSNSECQYKAKYGDGSRTTGTYSSDTLTLGSNTITDFQFGCGHVQSGMPEKAAGLMALGGGVQSLVSQTAGRFGTAFSYCLPPTSGSSGFLKLGAGAGEYGSDFAKTPMIRSSPIPTYYGLRLEAIRVGGKLLDIPSSVFASGLVVDSGGLITRLPRTAYSALSAAFQDGMSKYPRAPPSTSVLNTCYDFSGHSDVEITTIALVFAGGAAVDLAPEGILLEKKGYYCLAFAANGDDSSFGVIGNVQQRTIEVLYDIGGSSVGFRTGAC
jgi:hypothetical protein